VLVDAVGWWKHGEILIMPVLDEFLTPTLQVVQCAYKGNSKQSDNDRLWNNWSMMVQVVAPASAGACMSCT